MPQVHLLTISTATGTFPSTGTVSMGGVFRYAAYADNRTAANKDIAGTVQGTLGNSGKWQTILTLTTNSSGTIFSSTGTDLPLFDQLRVVVTANNSTTSFPAWLAASD